MVFAFGSVYVMDYIYRYAYIEPALHPQYEAYLIVMDKLVGVVLHSVCQYFFFDNFCVDVHMDIVLKFSFLVVPLPGFGIGMMLVS